MKRIKYIFLIVLLLPLICFGFPSTYQSSFATNPTLELQVPDNVVIGNKPEYLEFVATLSSVDEYNPSQILWFINGSSMTQTITVLGNTSTLRVEKSQYSNIVSKTMWTITAKISINDDVSASKQLSFDFSSIESVRLNINGPLVQEISNNITPVIFQAQYEGYPSTTTYQWFEKSYANKYTRVTNSSNTLTVTPTKPGVYTYKVNINGVFSEPKSIKVNYKPVSEIVVDCKQVTDNATGLNRYIFTITNLTEQNDLSKVRWYSRQTGLMQIGGLSYEIQASLYGSYHIYAIFEDTETQLKIESNIYPLEIKIDRTKEILIACSVLFGLMLIILIIGIIRAVKRDKIW